MKSKFFNYLVKFFLVSITLIIYWQSYYLYQNFFNLYQNEQKNLAEIKTLHNFLIEHPDYEQYQITLSEQLYKLQQKLPKTYAPNNIVNKILQVGKQSGVKVSSIKFSDNEKEKFEQEDILAYSLTLEIKGNYRCFLRWLKNIEQEGWQIKNLSIQGDGKIDLLKGRMLLTLYSKRQ